METVTMTPKPEASKREKEDARALVEIARSLAIQNDEDFTRADELLVSIADQKKEICARFDGIIKKTNAAHKEAVAQKRDLMDPRVEAETLIRACMAEYHQIKKAEVDRLAAEHSATAKVSMDEDRLHIAEQLEKSGRPQEAEAVLSRPVVAPSPTASWTPVPASKGTSFTAKWKARVVSLPDLVKAVAEGKAPAGLIKADESALNGMARALKSTASIPGVEFYTETGTIVRARK